MKWLACITRFLVFWHNPIYRISITDELGGIYDNHLHGFDDIHNHRYRDLRHGLGIGGVGVAGGVAGGVVVAGGGVRVGHMGIRQCQLGACNFRFIPAQCRYVPIFRGVAGYCRGCPEDICRGPGPLRHGLGGGIGGGLGGGIYGAFTPAAGPPGTAYTEYVEENEARLRDSLAKYPIQEYFQRAFLKEARAQTSHTFVVISEEGPQSDEGMVGQGVDTVLELSVQRIWLKRLAEVEGDTNPPMVVVLVVRVKLVRATEKTEWYDQTFVHETEKGPYDWWVHPIRFQGAIEKAYQDLAEQMVNELFITTQPSQQS